MGKKKQAGTRKKRNAKPAPVAVSADKRDDGQVNWLTVVGARQNNLRDLTVHIPLGRFVCVTGVSGSGKSSLVNDILREQLAGQLNGAVDVEPGLHDRIDGYEHLDKIIDIDQSPIGRTPRSNPATYIKVFDRIRALFAMLPDSKVRGYKQGRFSFNVATGSGGGRCEACEGNGSNKMDMDFLADIWVTCPVCNGKRFNRETLQIYYKGKNISDVLEMDVGQALDHFEPVPAIALMLRTLHDTGLDYIKLGQSSTTLSGGEAQRIKLARELVKKSTGRTLYLLDEPTTGLHFHDVKRLLQVLHGFVDLGNTVVVIEHNLDVVKTADWIIDLGPEGGDAGGRIVAQGTPEQVVRCKKSYTGQALRPVLGSNGDHKADPKRKRGASLDRGRANRNGKKNDVIQVVGARQHNLKNIDVELPRNKMTVCSGPSGSGKSSLAIDTIYTEGQRRYVESLSAYARQFLSRMQPPRVDHVYGLSPAICIEQKNASKSPRSTVGTVTEIYDYMRILWGRIGVPHCPKCKTPVGTQSADDVVDKLLALGDGTKVMLLSPVTPAVGESYEQMLRRARANGFVRVRIDGAVFTLDVEVKIDQKQRHQIELVVDRIMVRSSQRARITDSVEQALSMGNGVMIAQPLGDDEKRNRAGGGDLRFSQHRSCSSCGRSFEELTPHHFSFNSRMGWCTACEGLGVQQGASPAAIVVHPTRSILEGAIYSWRTPEPGSLLQALATAVAGAIGFSPDTPWNKLGESQRLAFLHGTGDRWIEVPDCALKKGTGTAGETAGATERVAGRGASPLFHGLRIKWRGFFPAIHRATRSSWQYRKRLEELVTEVACEACAGGRLRPDAAAVRVGVKTIHESCLMPLSACLAWFEKLSLSRRERKISGELLHEIISRLRFLVEVGLDYVSLHRSAATLSGGEAQRIQLASQIGTGLTGVLYVLDEPTIGLHPRDNARLIRAMHRLRKLGNTLVVVEHDREVIDSSDHVLDFGPGAGTLGGQITAAGSPTQLRSKRASLTGRYLSGKEAIPVPTNRRAVPFQFSAEPHALACATDGAEPRASARAIRAGARGSNGQEAAVSAPSTTNVSRGLKPAAQEERVSRGLKPAAQEERVSRGLKPAAQEEGVALTLGNSRKGKAPAARGVEHENQNITEVHWLIVHGAREHNLQEIDVAFPLSRFTCVTGVSGSGKSTLVTEILYNALASRIHRARLVPGGHGRISGIDRIDKVVNVDQSPIGMSPTSNPATYTGVFDSIRELYAKLPLSKIRGYGPQRFSFNRPGGRCEACEGMGQRCIEMHFLPDVWVECEHCKGTRYVPQTLEVQYHGKSIADVLAMNVSAALELLGNVPRVRRMLQTLDDVGLGYLQLGQSAPTLSGGEAQRVKLAAELGRPSTGKTLYILDEPTTGLHFDDLRKLLDVLHRLVDLGNTCICIEHNLDVIKTADWVIDLGPEAGERGGTIVVEGPPELIARTAASHTGAALKPVIDAGPHGERSVYDPRRRKKVEKQQDESIDLGGDTLMPWERDGKTWHTVNHVDRHGAPVQWDPKVLLWLVETIESFGAFEPTDWKHRSRIEIKAKGNQPWFCHILTGNKELLDVAIRVGPRTFGAVTLSKLLPVKKLDERTDLPIYGRSKRVKTRRPSLGWQEVRMFLRDFKDIRKPDAAKFLKQAVASYWAKIAETQERPEQAAPWTADGKQWHLSQRAIRRKSKIRWDPALLMSLIGRFKSIQPDLAIHWNHQTTVGMAVPGEGRPAGRIVTSLPRGLRVELRAPSGLLTPTQVERLGEEVEIKRLPAYDRVIFWLVSLGDNDAKQLRTVWGLCRNGGGSEQLRSA